MGMYSKRHFAIYIRHRCQHTRPTSVLSAPRKEGRKMRCPGDHLNKEAIHEVSLGSLRPRRARYRGRAVSNRRDSACALHGSFPSKRPASVQGYTTSYDTCRAAARKLTVLASRGGNSKRKEEKSWWQHVLLLCFSVIYV